MPTEDPKGPSGGIHSTRFARSGQAYGGGDERALTQLHRSLDSLRSLGMTGDGPPLRRRRALGEVGSTAERLRSEGVTTENTWLWSSTAAGEPLGSGKSTSWWETFWPLRHY